MPICASRRASCARRAHHARPGCARRRAAPGRPAGRSASPQCTGAPRSSAASRSSPSAAPSAVSKPRSTVICSSTAGNRSPVAAFRIFASVRASVSIRASSASASCSGGRAALSAPRACATACFGQRWLPLRPSPSAACAASASALLLAGIGKARHACAAISAASRSTSRSCCVQPVAALGGLAQPALELVARRRGLGALGGQLRKRRLADRQRRSRRVERFAASPPRARAAPAFSGFERRFLGVEPLQDVGIVARPSAPRGRCRRRAAAARRSSSAWRARTRSASSSICDLAIDRRWKRGGGRGFRVAQFRQAVGADRLFLGRVHLRRGALADQRRRGWPAPTAPRPPAPWPATSADAAASPRPCGCRPTGS